MYEATVTYQGQVTIPAPARKRLKIKAGDKLNFIVTDTGFSVSKAGDWESLRGVLSKYKGKYPTKLQLENAWIEK